MVQHMIIWQLKDVMTPQEKAAQAVIIKENLETLNGKIDGMISLSIQTEFILTAGGGDLMLLSSFESVEALKAYSANAEHNRIADTYIRPYIANRYCMDFEA